MAEPNWWTSLTNSIANTATSAVNSAKGLANKVMPGSVKVSEPLTTDRGVERVYTALGGVRERRGYTCTGARVRKCVKNTRRNKKHASRHK